MIAPIDIGMIIGYIVIVLMLGFWSARKSTPDEYLIHGRNIRLMPFIATVSASWVGGGAIVVFTAYAYEFGLAVIMAYLGICFGLWTMIFFAARMRHEAGELDHLTLADYFHHRIGQRAGLAVAIFLSVVFFFFIVNQFIAGSSVLSTISGWSYETALFISAAVVLFYLLLGGMRSVVKTDIFQYVTMLLLVIVIVISMIKKTGIDPVLLNPFALSPALAATFIIYGFFIPFVTADVWQRVYAADSPSTARKGLFGSGICILVLGLTISMIGLSAKTAFPGIEPSEAAAYGMAHLLSPGFLGLGLVVLFAAIMSSADTLVFYVSTSVAKDYFGQILSHPSKKDLESITRCSIVVVTFLTAGCAFFLRDIISVLIAIAGVNVALVPPFLASLRWKLKQNAVVASLAASGIYMGFLVVADLIIPEYSILSLFISGFVLWGWQRWGK